MKTGFKLMIAGIGGASLGTEIMKCLMLTEHYTVFGCDISPLAYGHYQEGFEETFVVSREYYIDSVLEACNKVRCDCIIPGGEEPMILLGEAKTAFEAEGIQVAINAPEIIGLCSNKLTCFKTLTSLGFAIPETRAVAEASDLHGMPFPCIIKPMTGSGGSVFTFLARDSRDAILYVDYLINNGKTPVAQEYVQHEEGEFTIGVLSLPNQQLVCSIAMQRSFQCKLSVFFSSETGLISSGYSQGLIDDFPDHRKTAEAIAVALKSSGPINVQGRVRNGILLPFEINPRFSASTYLRALAGINEVDIYLQSILASSKPAVPVLRPGLYLRSLTETFVPKELRRS